MNEDLKIGGRGGLALFILFLAGILPYELNGWYNPMLENSPAVFWGADAFIFVCLPIAAYIYGTRRGLFTRQELGFHFDLHGRAGAVMFFAGLVIMPVVLYYATTRSSRLAASVLQEACEKKTFGYEQVFGQMSSGKLIMVTYASVTAGLVEEFYYRGMFKLLFRPGRLNTVFYVIASAVIFSSVHWEGGPCQLFYTLVYGLIAAAAYALIKNIWPLVIAHMVLDVIWFQ